MGLVHESRKVWSAVIVIAGLGIPAGSALAQGPVKLDPVTSFQTVKVADRVYAFITPEERTGFQAGNSIAVIGEDGVLVIDSGNIPGSTRRQIKEIRRLTDKPVRFVVNTHWHPDHNLGNSEYRAAFPGVTIIGSSATRIGIIQRIPGYMAQMKGFATTDSLMRLRLSTGKMRDGSVMNDTVRVMWTLVTGDYAAFLPEVTSAKALPPDLVFDDSLTITLGQRQVKVIRPGRANTAGDAYVYVPDVKVLITGDLITLPCPFPSTSFFSDWIQALDRLKALNAEAIVPGHGAVQHDYQYVDLVRELLVYTREKAQDAVRRGLTLEQATKEIDFTDYARRFSGGDLVRYDAFQSFYPQPAIQRAYEEAKFMSEGPVAEEGKQ